MPRWITVPLCHVCGNLMKEDDEEDYICIECGEVTYGSDLDNE